MFCAQVVKVLMFLMSVSVKTNGKNVNVSYHDSPRIRKTKTDVSIRKGP